MTCLRRRSGRKEAPPRLLRAREAGSVSAGTHLGPGSRALRRLPPWKQSRGGRRFPPPPLLHSARRGQRTGSTLPDSQGWRGFIVCPGTQAPLSDARPPGLAEQSMRVRDCEPEVGPQGGWAEGVGPLCAGPVSAGSAAGTTSTGPRGGEHLPPAGYRAELGASWGSRRLRATADAGGVGGGEGGL